jgi:hypothetical protein
MKDVGSLVSVYKLKYTLCHSGSPQAGIQCFKEVLDSCLRRNDNTNSLSFPLVGNHSEKQRTILGKPE